MVGRCWKMFGKLGPCNGMGMRMTWGHSQDLVHDCPLREVVLPSAEPPSLEVYVITRPRWYRGEGDASLPLSPAVVASRSLRATILRLTWSNGSIKTNFGIMNSRFRVLDMAWMVCMKELVPEYSGLRGILLRPHKHERCL